MKFKVYKFDKEFINPVVSLKVDGVRVHITDGVALSRAGKPLYNLPPLPDGIYEVYTGTWEGSITAVRTIDGPTVNYDHIYRIDPGHVSSNLTISRTGDPDTIRTLFNIAKSTGYEGLVVWDRDTNIHYKVKDTETYDVEVLGIQPGKGKNLGKMGALITSMGKVGTGFTDKVREEAMNWKGKTIEVEAMELTPQGKFRHPRFVRLREDK